MPFDRERFNRSLNSDWNRYTSSKYHSFNYKKDWGRQLNSGFRKVSISMPQPSIVPSYKPVSFGPKNSYFNYKKDWARQLNSGFPKISLSGSKGTPASIAPCEFKPLVPVLDEFNPSLVANKACEFEPLVPVLDEFNPAIRAKHNIVSSNSNSSEVVSVSQPPNPSADPRLEAFKKDADKAIKKVKKIGKSFKKEGADIVKSFKEGVDTLASEDPPEMKELLSGPGAVNALVVEFAKKILEEATRNKKPLAYRIRGAEAPECEFDNVRTGVEVAKGAVTEGAKNLYTLSAPTIIFNAAKGGAQKGLEDIRAQKKEMIAKGCVETDKKEAPKL